MKGLTSALTRRIVETIGASASMPFRALLPDGSEVAGGQGKPVVVAKFKTVKAAWRTILFGHVGFLEAYFDGDIDIEGDLRGLMTVGFDSGFDESSRLLGRCICG